MVKAARSRGGLAIAIVAMVCAEAIRRAGDAGFLQDGHVARLLKIVQYAASTLGYPTLFFLLGLSTAACLQRSRAQVLKSAALSVLYPYLLWSILQTGVQWMVAETRGYSLQEIDLTRLAVAPVGQFWFLYALFVCQVVSCITVWSRSDTSGSGLTVASRCLISVLIVAAAVVATRSHWGVFTMTAWGFVFFLSGVLFAGRRQRPGDHAPRLRVTLATAIAFGAAAVFGQRSGSYLSVYSLPASILGIAAAVSVGGSLTSWRSSRWIVWLGASWKPIYLLHVMAIAALWNALLALGIRQPVVHVALGIATGLAVPVAIYLAMRRFGFARWAGFEDLAASSSDETEVSGLEAQRRGKTIKSRA